MPADDPAEPTPDAEREFGGERAEAVGLRSKLKRLTECGWLAEDEPGLFKLPRRSQAHFGAGGHLMACDHVGEILATLTSAFKQDGKEC